MASNGRSGAGAGGGAGAESTVLEETIDESYEPTAEEIAEYAQWLGMDLEADKHLFWVAREGLKAPLPSEWKACKSPDGEIYYFNFSNGERCAALARCMTQQLSWADCNLIATFRPGTNNQRLGPSVR